MWFQEMTALWKKIGKNFQGVEWNKCTLVTQNILLFNLFFQCIYLEPSGFLILTVYLHFFQKLLNIWNYVCPLCKMYLTTWKENKAQITQLVRVLHLEEPKHLPHRLTPEREINLGTLASITPGTMQDRNTEAERSKLRETRWEHADRPGRRQAANKPVSGPATEAVSVRDLVYKGQKTQFKVYYTGRLS